MIEVDLQKLAVDAVKQNGGFAAKLAHKFFKGFPDLMVVWRGMTWILEAKRVVYVNMPDLVTVDIEVNQLRWLDDIKQAGGDTGLLSFVQLRKGLAVSVLDHRDRPFLHRMQVPKDNYFVTESRLVVDRQAIVMKALETLYT